MRIEKLAVWASVILSLAGVALADTPGVDEVAAPEIPAHQFNLKDYGAVADGKTLNTDAFAKAVAAVADAGGGTLTVPSGTYLTMPFKLTSHMDLHLDAGAVIQFPNNLEAYGLPTNPAKANAKQMDDFRKSTPALVRGNDLTDVAITGEGAIDGGGSVWWPLARMRDGTAHTAYGNDRPKLLVLTNCRRVAVRGVTLRNSPMYHLVPTMCQDVLVDGVHITAPGRAPNTDAIDPMASQNVLIRDCDLDVGDDDVAVKATQGPCSNIRVENCRCKHGHGISIGSETYKGIHDVTVRDCTFEGTTNGIRIKSARDRGNALYGFAFSNISMKNVGTAITINLYYMDKTGSRAHVAMPVTASTPTLRDVHIENVNVTGAQTAGDITGLPESNVKDVTFSNVSISAHKGMSVSDAQGIVFRNVDIQAAVGEPLVSDHADVDWDRVVPASGTHL